MGKSIFERLREERERLGKKKGEMAILGGVSDSAYTNYESGARSPGGEFYSAIAAAGADVQYILTGVHAGAPALSVQEERAGYVVQVLNREEQALLDNYRHAPEVGKAAIQAAGDALAQSKKVKGK